jgi:hypothetical protein
MVIDARSAHARGLADLGLIKPTKILVLKERRHACPSSLRYALCPKEKKKKREKKKICMCSPGENHMYVGLQRVTASGTLKGGMDLALEVTQ